jgi:hypothetical protein
MSILNFKIWADFEFWKTKSSNRVGPTHQHQSSDRGRRGLPLPTVSLCCHIPLRVCRGEPSSSFSTSLRSSSHFRCSALARALPLLYRCVHHSATAVHRQAVANGQPSQVPEPPSTGAPTVSEADPYSDLPGPPEAAYFFTAGSHQCQLPPAAPWLSWPTHELCLIQVLLADPSIDSGDPWFAPSPLFPAGRSAPPWKALLRWDTPPRDPQNRIPESLWCFPTTSPATPCRRLTENRPAQPPRRHGSELLCSSALGRKAKWARNT